MLSCYSFHLHMYYKFVFLQVDSYHPSLDVSVNVYVLKPISSESVGLLTIKAESAYLSYIFVKIILQLDDNSSIQ